MTNNHTPADAAEFAAASIRFSVTKDAELAAAQDYAGTALWNAAVHTAIAINVHGATAKAIAEFTNGVNKDTVARLAIVGMVLQLPGEFQPEGISPAHVLRSLVNAAVANKAGLPAIRNAVLTSEDQPSAAAALAKLGQPVVEAVTPDDEGDENEGGSDENEVEVDDFNKALQVAMQAIKDATASAPLAATDEDRHAVQAVYDAVVVLGLSLGVTVTV